MSVEHLYHGLVHRSRIVLLQDSNVRARQRGQGAYGIILACQHAVDLLRSASISGSSPAVATEEKEADAEADAETETDTWSRQSCVSCSSDEVLKMVVSKDPTPGRESLSKLINYINSHSSVTLQQSDRTSLWSADHALDLGLRHPQVQNALSGSSPARLVARRLQLRLRRSACPWGRLVERSVLLGGQRRFGILHHSDRARSQRGLRRC